MNDAFYKNACLENTHGSKVRTWISLGTENWDDNICLWAGVEPPHQDSDGTWTNEYQCGHQSGTRVECVMNDMDSPYFEDFFKEALPEIKPNELIEVVLHIKRSPHA